MEQPGNPEELCSDAKQFEKNIKMSSKVESGEVSVSEEPSVKDKQDGHTRTESDLECSICLQTAVHPVELPCKHIFCYLCVKGSANRSKRCALCRQEIPHDYIYKPTLLRKEDLVKENSFEDGHQWYYEGNRGWWQYDERTSAELESKYIEKCEKLEILIAGFLYVVDFENMYQYRRNDPSRRRKIKRDLVGIPKKGVAGLRIKSNATRPVGDGNEEDNASQGQASASGTSVTQNSQVVSGRQNNVLQHGASGLSSYQNTKEDSREVNTNNRHILPSDLSHDTNRSAFSLLPEHVLEYSEVNNEDNRIGLGNNTSNQAQTEQNASSNNAGDENHGDRGGDAGQDTESVTETLGLGVAGMTLDDALANTDPSRGHGMQLRRRNRRPLGHSVYDSPNTSEDSDEE